MIARSWWPLQRWLAVRPAIAMSVACAPILALGACWRPSDTLGPAALASVVAVLAPVILARGDGSRRRLAGRATGTALVIAQPLIVAACLVDVRLLWPILVACVSAVVLPAVLPVRPATEGHELGPEPESGRAPWLLPLAAVILAGVVLVSRASVRVSVPEASLVVMTACCAALWIATSMRVLLAIAVAAVTCVALALVAASMPAVSPVTVALALSATLPAWFQRESAAGFSRWTPAVVVLATTIAFAPDPTAPMMAMLAALTWLVAATYPAARACEPPAARSSSSIAWSQRVFTGLEPYWRFYARAKLARDPIYRRLAAESRPWGSILDAGCGPGLVAVLAAARGGTRSYLGIDLDVDKLLVARRASSLAGRLIGSSWRLRQDRFPLASPMPERFDSVFVLDVLHYWPGSLQATILGQLIAMLEVDGRLYLREGVRGVDGDAGQVERCERFTTFFGLNPETEMTFFDKAEIAALISCAGGVIESDEPMGSNHLWVCRRA